MQDCISKTRRWVCDSQNKKELKEKKTNASLPLISKTLLNTFSENPKKKLHYQLSYFHPCSLELSIHFHIMMNAGTQVDTSDPTLILINVGHTETLFPHREHILFSLRQTVPQKRLSINPLSSFWISIILGSYTVAVTPRRTWQHSDFKARHTAKYLFLIPW